MPLPRVLHLVTALAPGGLERMVVGLCNGRNVRSPGSSAVCCLDEPGRLAARIGGGGVSVLGAARWRKPWDGAAVGGLRRMLHGYDVLHSHNLAAWQYGALACLGARVRHVHTEHGSNPHTTGPANRLRLRVLALAAHELAAVSASTRAALVAAGLAARRIRVVPNGVDVLQGVVTADERDRARAEQAIPSGALVIGYVGRMEVIKGVDRLVRAFGAIRVLRPDSRLLLIGEGGESAHLRQLADEAGCAGSVEFAGHRDELRSWWACMDRFVLPSRSEGLPLALLEAMSLGVPVCATGVGEVRQVLDGARCGRLLPDVESQWAEVILADPAPGQVEAARVRVVSDYALDRTLDRYEELYGAR